MKIKVDTQAACMTDTENQEFKELAEMYLAKVWVYIILYMLFRFSLCFL